MSYYCNVHKASNDSCQDCLKDALSLIKKMVSDHLTYETILGWKPTEAVIEAKEFLKNHEEVF